MPSTSMRIETWPWSRALVLVAVVGPALWLGGVPAPVVPAFIGVIALLWLRQGRAERELCVPAGAWVFGLLCAVTALQLVPLPEAVLARIAPGSHELVSSALAGTSIGPWRSISVNPPATALELARVLGLGLLFVAAAQLSWRISASAVVVCATLVASLGLVHEALGLDAIYGLYTPRMREAGDTAAALTSFVNPNHQAGLFLLASFAAAGLAQDLYLRADRAIDEDRARKLRDRCLVTLAALAALLASLMSSLSRSALLVLALLAPIALFSILRERRRNPAQRQLSPLALLLCALPFVAIVLVAASRGVTPQLETLSDPSSYAIKPRVVRESLQLVSFSPVLGIGRGSFVDLFPLVDSAPGPVVFTHLESTPVMMLVEWGPVAGAIALLGASWWWLRAVKGAQSVAKRVALLGILAVAMQGLADFSLEFLGVAAPAVALAGSASARGREVSRKLWLGAGLGLITLALAFAWLGRDAGWAARLDANASMSATEARAALGQRPLDGRLHLRIARDAFEEEDWASAEARATVATKLLPASADAWILLGAAAGAVGELERADEATARALARVATPLSPEFVAYLLARYPDADHLAALAPEHADAWILLGDALVATAPRHALVLARHRVDAIGDGPALELGFAAARALDNAALALHYARLLAAREPERAQAHLRVADALTGFSAERSVESIAALEAALDYSLDDRGLVEERLLSLLLARPDDERALARARVVAEQLLTRAAPRKIKARRERMVKRLAKRLAERD